jgi:fermentation-respiration switch protein FrsA (DUF1100 family)
MGSPIVVFGRSLGGAVCFSLAKKFPKLVQGIIVENTFVSVARMVDKLMPLVSGLKSLILRIGWDSGEIVPHIKQPVLYISGDSDELVPTSHMRELYSKTDISTYRDFYNVIGGTHNDTWVRAGAAWYERIKDFLNKSGLSRSSGSSGSSSSSSSGSSSSNNNNINGNDCEGPSIALPTMKTDFSVQ